MSNDSDLAFMKEFTSQLREHRKTHFEKNWFYKFWSLFGDAFFWDHKMGCYRYDLGGKQFDFYPKANKVFHHPTQRWIKPGLRWMIKTYLK